MWSDYKEVYSQAESIIVSEPRELADFVVSWDCVWFGQYPQAEVIPQDYIYDSLLNQLRGWGDIIKSTRIYNMLESATGWDENGDIILEGKKYRRISLKDTNQEFGDTAGYYKWGEDREYHYFQYQPITWRVLAIEEGKLLLLADVALEGDRYNSVASPGALWTGSRIRQKLNEDFYEVAFREEEKNAICSTTSGITAGEREGSHAGVSHKDSVFLLSLDDLRDGEQVKRYGFMFKGEEYTYYHYECMSSTYAKAMGVNSDTYDDNLGGCYWWLSSNDTDNMTEQDGYLWNHMGVAGKWGIWQEPTYNCYGIRPAIYIDAAQTSLYTYAGTVDSGTNKIDIPIQTEAPTQNPVMTDAGTVTPSSEPIIEPTIEPEVTIEPSPGTTPTRFPAVSPAPKVTTTPDIGESPKQTLEPAKSEEPKETISPTNDLKNDSNSLIQSEGPAPSVAPIVPSDMMFSGISSMKVKETKQCFAKITWSHLEGAQGYEVYRSQKKSSTYTLIKSVEAKKRSYTDKSVIPGSAYYYKVIPKGSDDRKAMLERAIQKKIILHHLTQPVIMVKKARTSSGQRYVEISLKRYEGDYAQIYYKAKEEAQFHRLKIQKKKIIKYRKRFKLRYKNGGVTLCFKVRTFVVKNGKKRYSRYSKVVRKTL